MTQLQIVGSEVCAHCSVLGHDADFCRANRLVSGDVLCYTCQGITPPSQEVYKAVENLPYPVKRVVVAILRRPADSPAAAQIRLAHKAIGEINDPAGAVLNNNVESMLGAGRLNFSTTTPSLANCNIRYHEDELGSFSNDSFKADAGSASQAQALATELTRALCPEALSLAAARLMEIGFTVLHVQLNQSLRRVVLVHPGSGEVNRQRPRGITAELLFVI